MKRSSVVRIMTYDSLNIYILDPHYILTITKSISTYFLYSCHIGASKKYPSEGGYFYLRIPHMINLVLLVILRAFYMTILIHILKE